MDAVMHTAAFHMQCSHYDHIKPPSFFDYPHLNANYLTRSRERSEAVPNESERLQRRAVRKSIEPVMFHYTKQSSIPVPNRAPFGGAFRSGSGAPGLYSSSGNGSSCMDPVPLEGAGRFDGNWGNLFSDGRATFLDRKHPNHKDPAGFASTQGGRTPPLFLQELAHLASLMTGVALSTLRNDIEGAESPLDVYEPGAPWPSVDPFTETKTSQAGLKFTVWDRCLNFLGIHRTQEERTRHNSARPLPILGGVSEGEIRFLQMARGPGAKTQLAWYWLSEFITREHLAGSLGKVGPPIVSRIIQFLGDGMIFYNHARKIMFIPFPFPHAQLTAFYVIMCIPSVAILMDQYVEEIWTACILAFLTVTCLAGIHEVARELENPFRNVPNELPLVTLQAQWNETLLVMFSGYHPDFYWQDQANDSTSGTAEMSSASETSSPAASERPLPKKSDKVNNVSVKDVLEVVTSQHEELDKQMKEMKAKHKQEVESQQKEIQDLQAQLRALKSKGGE